MQSVFQLGVSAFLIVLFTACSSSSGSDTTLIEESNTTELSTDDNTSVVDVVIDENTTVIVDENITVIDANMTFEDAVVHNDSFSSLHFSGSKNCAGCHDGLSDSTGKDVSIAKAWGVSMMANSAIDPLWRAKVASEVKRNPAYKEAIESKCSKCHTPMATTEAKFAGETVALFDEGFLNPQNPHYDEATDGVSCTLCHQIENTADLGTSTAFSGAYTIADNTSTERKAYGQFSGVNTTPMRNNVQFTPAYSAHMNESKLCATCHNLETPVISADGVLSDLHFSEQAVYTEWEYSEFNTSQTCQDCHMSKAEGSVILSTRGGNLQSRSPFFQHQFLGANTYMINIINNNKATLGTKAATADFDKMITDTRDFLMASADLNITGSAFKDGKLNFTLTLTNHSGHKFPTSYPSRRAWIHVSVVDDVTQETVFESGAFDSEGKLIGVDEETSTVYEPHYQKITEEDQVQVYETVMADTNAELTYTLMHASQYLKDNRLLPKGFEKASVPESIQVFGEAKTDNDFIGGSDEVDYEIALPEASYTITATLRYETTTYGFRKDLFKDAELKEVALMKALDNNTSNHYETISSHTQSISLP